MLKIGDLVEVAISDGGDYTYDYMIGWVGKVACFSLGSGNPGVEFKNPFDMGHDCRGNVKPHCGRFIPEKLLKRINGTQMEFEFE